MFGRGEDCSPELQRRSVIPVSPSFEVDWIYYLVNKWTVWAYDLNSPHALWIQGRKETLLRHLKSKCPYQPADVKQRAQEESVRIGLVTSPSRPLQGQAHHDHTPIDPALTTPSPLIFASTLNSLPTPSLPPISIPPVPYHLSYGQQALYSASASLPPSPFTEVHPSPVPSDLSASSRPSKRLRLSRQSSARNSQADLPVWSDAHQERFASRIARLTASCGFPFLWVDNPEWHAFCAEFIPGAQMIGRKSLANNWIPAEAGKYRKSAMERARGQEVTLQCDGWSGVNSHHYIAFMITTSRREVRSHSFDIQYCHTARYLGLYRACH